MNTDNLKTALKFYNENVATNTSEWKVVGTNGRGVTVNVPELIANYLALVKQPVSYPEFAESREPLSLDTQEEE